MPAKIVYVNASTSDEALAIGRAVVAERLAASANVLGGLQSVYWWNGRVNEGSEAALILKTEEAALPALIARVRALHSYDCPCVVAFPIDGGNPDYLAWIARESSPVARTSGTSANTADLG